MKTKSQNDVTCKIKFKYSDYNNIMGYENNLHAVLLFNVLIMFMSNPISRFLTWNVYVSA